MKKKTVWIIGAIVVLGALAVIFALARAWAYRPILIEGTIADEQGKAMNGVSVYVSFVRRRGEDHYFPIQELEETVDSSFHFEGRGDDVIVIFSKKGYAPMILPAIGRNDHGKLIRRDLRIVMKELTPEELEKRLFGNIHSWRSNDYIVRYEGEEYPTDEDQLERLRKNYGLEKSDMTDLFVKAIQDYLSGKETNPENQTLQDRGRFVEAIYDLEYYPPHQQQFLELIRKVVELEPESADTLILSYTKAYPDWVFDDGTILELTCKSEMEEFNLREAGSDLRKQVRQEKDEVRRKKLLDKAFEWAFQDDKIKIFYKLDRLLLDHYEKEYATNPGRKLQLEKDLKRHEEAEIYDWVYRRTKYALEHFGEEDEALEMLYKMDTDPKKWDGEWERSERKRRIRESIEEWKKEGNDPSYIFSEKYLEEIYSDE